MFRAAVALLLVAASARAAEIKHVIDVYHRIDSSYRHSLEFRERGKPGQVSIPLRLNDVVSVEMTFKVAGGGAVLLEHWEGREAWKETKKQGKTTTIITN